MQEEQLVRKAQSGDDSAFEQLLLQHQKNVYNLCLRLLQNPDDAQDAAQESFLRAWRNLDQYHFDAAFSTWLYRLTRNLCLDELRKKKRRPQTSLSVQDEEGEERELEIADPAPVPEEALLQKEQQRAVALAMEQLPPEQREILQLRVVQELPYEQIAEILGLPVGTVKSRLARARIQLKKNLADGNLSVSETSNKQKMSGGVCP